MMNVSTITNSCPQPDLALAVLKPVSNLLYLFRMKAIFTLLTLGACISCMAQTPAANMMPDGSRDMYVGLGVGSAPLCGGDGERKTQLVPNVQVQWSNGIFLRNESIGMHFGAEPGFEYGPIAEYERGCSAADSRNLAAVGDNNSSVGVGGFFNYYPVADFRLGSKLLIGTSGEHKRALLNVEARKYIQLATHHGLALSLGMSWANRDYAQTPYEFQPAMASSEVKFLAAEPPTTMSSSAGVKEVHIAANWNWELSADWLVTSQVTLYRLGNSATDTALSDRRSYATVYTGLARRF